jgi:GAF domain-containing protein
MPPRKRYFPRKPLPVGEPAPPRERRDLDAVRDILHAAVRGESAEEVLQFALDRIAPQLGASLGSVYLLDGASELMRLVAAHQWPERYRPWLGAMRVRVGFGPSGEAASERRVIDVPDVFADPDLEDWHDVARELGFAAITALPLLAAGRVLGVATFYFREAAAVSADARALLRLVADLMAATAEQAARRDELRRVNAALHEATAEVERQFEAVGNAQRTRDDFLEGISLDLRAPLQGLLANLARLDNGAAGTAAEGQRHEVRAVRAAATRVLAVVEALADFGGARRGTLELDIDEFDPRVPMREAVRDAGTPAQGVAVVAIDPVLALPPMRGDRRKLVRLLVTLLEHVREQGRLNRVEITVESSDGRVRYRLQETGTLRAGADDEDTAAEGDAAATISWVLDLARSVGRLLGGAVSADASEGRVSFTLDLPVEGPPPAPDARG